MFKNLYRVAAIVGGAAACFVFGDVSMGIAFLIGAFVAAISGEIGR